MWNGLGKTFHVLNLILHMHVSHIGRSEPRGVGCRTPGFEMQIGKQWQRLNKHSEQMCMKPTGQTAHAHCISETSLWVQLFHFVLIEIKIIIFFLKLFFVFIYFTTVTPTHRNNLLDVLWLSYVCFPWLLPPQPSIYQPMFRPCGIQSPHWIHRPCCQQKLLCSRSRLWPASSLPCWLSHLVSNNLWIHIGAGLLLSDVCLKKYVHILRILCNRLLIFSET